MRECWNWQTGTFEGRVLYDVRVQVPSRAPNQSTNFDTKKALHNGELFCVYARKACVHAVFGLFFFPAIVQTYFLTPVFMPARKVLRNPRRSHRPPALPE